MELEGTGVVIRENPKSLKLSLRGSVERQARHQPDRLNKPRTGVGLLCNCVEKRGGTTGVLYQRAREKGERERTGYVRPKIHRDTALRHRRRELDTNIERRERIIYI